MTVRGTQPFDYQAVSLVVSRMIGHHSRRKCIAIHTFDGLVDWATHHIVFSVACNSDSETLAAPQQYICTLYPDKNRLDADMFPVFSVGCT